MIGFKVRKDLVRCRDFFDLLTRNSIFQHGGFVIHRRGSAVIGDLNFLFGRVYRLGHLLDVPLGMKKENSGESQRYKEYCQHF